MRKQYLLFSVVIVLIFLITFFYQTYHRASVPKEQQIKSQPSVQTTSIPSFDHIVLIILENKPSDQILNNPDAPYLNSLIKQYSLAANYRSVAVPSLPNYLALIGGSTFDIESDCQNCFIRSKNLIDSLESKGKSWKAYMESMPKSCFVGSADPYAQRHNPFIYFDDIKNNLSRCNKIVPFDQLDKDLPNVPNFVWITPNLCNDMHDCPIKTGDDWLSQQVPKLLNSDMFQKQNSLLVITFDEGSSASNNKVVTVLIGPKVKKSYVSQVAFTHYSLLRTIESAWGLPVLTLNDETAPLMSDFF